MQKTQLCANGHHTLIFNINETSHNTNNNTSTVSWSVQLQPKSGWDFYTINSTLTVTIDGKQVYNVNTTRDCDGRNTVTWASGTETITHNSDGTKTASFSVSYTQSSTANYTPGNTSLSGSISLTNIPRATTLPELSGYIEDTYNITIYPASTSFTHSLKIAFGSITKYVNASGNLQDAEYKFATNTSPSNIPFKIPADYYQQFTGTSGTGTMTLTTYNGSSSVGTKTAKITANCLESRCKPSVTATVKDSNTTTTGLTGDANKIVKGYSNALVTLTVKAATTSGDTKSTISSRQIDGATVSGNTRTINKATKKDFKVIVKNSRGFSTEITASATGTLINYFEPNFTANFVRSPDQTSTTVKLTYKGTFWNGNFGSKKNTLTLKWYYKTSSASSWTTGGTITPTISGNNVSQATITCGTSFAYTNEYRFKLEATDLLSTVPFEATVTKGYPMFSAGDDWFQFHVPNVYDSSNIKLLDYKAMWPVGAVYITATNTNPQTFFSGTTWVAFGSGQTLVGVNTNDNDFKTPLKTGGSKTHTLTIDEMPNHEHGLHSGNEYLVVAGASAGVGITGVDMSSNGWWAEFYKGADKYASAGGGKAHSIVQPYITVYFWRRTA